MKISSWYSATLLASSMLCAALGGCVVMPPVNKEIDHAPADPPTVVGAHGLLPASQSHAIIRRLEQQEKGTDLLQRHLAIEEALSGAHLIAGNRTKLLHNGPETFRAIFRAIAAAKHYVLLEYYIFENVRSGRERLSNLLIAKRRKGVEIAIIYDGYGSMDTPSTFIARLKKAGIAIIEFHPLNPFKTQKGYSLNDRDHRKILVVDGSTAIVGGVNLYTGYQRHPHAKLVGSQGNNSNTWHDTDIEITGPAAKRLTEIFLKQWKVEGGRPLPAVADAPPPRATGHQLVRIIASDHRHAIPPYDATLLSAINSAKKTIWLTAAYFVPSSDEMRDLEAAARRGVDVRLMLPGKSDSALALAAGRSRYQPLLRAGVKIFEFQDGYLHSKCAVIDGVWSTIGSSNFDYRSILFNDEVDAVILGRNTARKLEVQFENEESDAREIRLKKWKRRPLAEKIKELYSRAVQDLL